MPKRVIRFLVAVILLLVIGLAFLWWTAPRHRIDEATYTLIKVGMSEAEVVGLLRAEAGDHRTGEKDGFYDAAGAMAWCSDTALIEVWFDADGLVSSTSFQALVQGERWTDRIRAWLGRL